MFFRHQKPKEYTFSDRCEMARSAGFQVQSAGGKTRASRNGIAANLSDAGEGKVSIEHPGVLIKDDIGVLVDVGYQKVFQTHSGVRVPARAEHLKELHAFGEDLREALGLTSFYNEGLGSTNELHLYDRVVDRDRGVPARPWARK
ncbi:MAG: hypothetical protein U0Q16_32430 [Bryobacteraceae bacterium]